MKEHFPTQFMRPGKHYSITETRKRHYRKRKVQNNITTEYRL